MASRYGVAVADIVGAGSEFTQPAAWTDAEVLSLIEEMEDWVDELTNDKWDSNSRAYVFDGTGQKYLFLTEKTRLRCLSVTNVVYRSDYADSFDSDGTTCDSDSYIRYNHLLVRVSTNETTRLITEEGVWERGRQNYRVTGTWGHASVPVAIKRAVVLLVRERITPGSSMSEAPLAEEQWADYRYRLREASATSDSKKGVPILSGYPAVDRLLMRHRNRRPVMRVLGKWTR